MFYKQPTPLSSWFSGIGNYFEWFDRNNLGEDRIGYFVNLIGKQIVIADSDTYIVGVTCSNVAVIGNADSGWKHRYITDDFGRWQETEKEMHIMSLKPKIDEEKSNFTTEIICEEETNLINESEKCLPEIETEFEWKDSGLTTKNIVFQENPNYDPSKIYVSRAERKEWEIVCLYGIVAVRDDGTCWEDGFCQPADGGIATAAFEYVPGKTYRVIERVSENVIKILLK